MGVSLEQGGRAYRPRTNLQFENLKVPRHRKRHKELSEGRNCLLLGLGKLLERLSWLCSKAV